MSAHLSDQALELLMAMSTGALARAGAKRYPALAQHFGIQPEAPPAEHSMALVPVVPPADEFPGVEDTAVSFPGVDRVHRNIQADTLDTGNRALIGRVPASVHRSAPLARVMIPVPGSAKGELKPAHKDSERFMKREGIDASELYNTPSRDLKGRTIPDTAEPQAIT